MKEDIEYLLQIKRKDVSCAVKALGMSEELDAIERMIEVERPALKRDFEIKDNDYYNEKSFEIFEDRITWRVCLENVDDYDSKDFHGIFAEITDRCGKATGHKYEGDGDCTGYFYKLELTIYKGKQKK